MKTSLFDMAFTLPPMIGMVKEEKDMPKHRNFTVGVQTLGHRWCRWCGS